MSNSPEQGASQVPAKRPLTAAAKVGIGCAVVAFIIVVSIILSVISAVNSIGNQISGGTDGPGGKDRGLACVYPFVLDNGESVIDHKPCN
jgi:hypothetical protein